MSIVINSKNNIISFVLLEKYAIDFIYFKNEKSVTLPFNERDIKCFFQLLEKECYKPLFSSFEDACQQIPNFITMENISIYTGFRYLHFILQQTVLQFVDTCLGSKIIHDSNNCKSIAELGEKMRAWQYPDLVNDS